jgi:hypothetical protein
MTTAVGTEPSEATAVGSEPSERGEQSEPVQSDDVDEPQSEPLQSEVGGSVTDEPQSEPLQSEEVGGRVTDEPQSEPEQSEEVGGMLTDEPQSEPQSDEGGGTITDEPQSDVQSDDDGGTYCDGGTSEQYMPQLLEMLDQVGGESEMDDDDCDEMALWHDWNADSTEDGEVWSFQLQPRTVTLSEPMLEPEKPKSWRLGEPSELQMSPMRPAMEWSYETSELDDTRRILSEKLWMLLSH